MAKYVEVLDSIMGSHKTNGIIKWMDENPDERYMYVSPLLSEVSEGSRLQTDLKYIDFEYPESKGEISKSDDLLAKLKSNVNICCTHSLYLLMDDNHLYEIERRGYIVIIDEELGVINSFKHYTADDIKYLLENKHIHIADNDGMITWIGQDLGAQNQYKQLSNLCKAKAIYAAKREDSVMVTQLPIQLFTAAKRVIIMTYMFEGNILDCFLRVKGVEVREFTEVQTTTITKEEIKKLITLIPPNKTLMDYRMSSGGYDDMPQADCTTIATYIRNVCRNAGANSEDVLYTFPKRLSQTARANGKKIRPKSFIEYKTTLTDAGGKPVLDKNGKPQTTTESCWLYSSCRATNKYAFKWCLVHCYNRFPDKNVETYLQDYKHSPSRNTFALSELCQWVWRSRIRKHEPIVLAIGSKRMYNLFQRWLDTN